MIGQALYSFGETGRGFTCFFHYFLEGNLGLNVISARASLLGLSMAITMTYTKTKCLSLNIIILLHVSNKVIVLIQFVIYRTDMFIFIM